MCTELKKKNWLQKDLDTDSRVDVFTKKKTVFVYIYIYIN